MTFDIEGTQGLPQEKVSLVPRPFPPLVFYRFRYEIHRPFQPPVFHHFQYEIQRGEAWEIWSHVMMSGRQMVDTRGAVPNRL